MSPRARAIHWVVFAVATAVLVAGVAAARVSSWESVGPITLSAGNAVAIPVFRLFPDSVRLSLRFERAPGRSRPELGEWAAMSGPDYIAFDFPGDPIVVRVRAASAAVDFEALPTADSGVGGGAIHRKLVVRAEDGNARRFPWPPNNAARPRLPVGSSMVTIEVAEVGARLSGESVSVVIEAPLSWKSVAPGYGFLWWFYFWPVIATVLTFYGAFLLWKTFEARGVRRSRRA